MSSAFMDFIFGVKRTIGSGIYIEKPPLSRLFLSTSGIRSLPEYIELLLKEDNPIHTTTLPIIKKFYRERSVAGIDPERVIRLTEGFLNDLKGPLWTNML
ncbi:MAG: hypothetical protein FJZ63_08020, partial [Chlamydiae bacterium]|nr:hypothetical protein [Chlamydiota bacterium]